MLGQPEPSVRVKTFGEYNTLVKYAGVGKSCNGDFLEMVETLGCRAIGLCTFH
jgi:hypothetical protein